MIMIIARLLLTLALVISAVGFSPRYFRPGGALRGRLSRLERSRLVKNNEREALHKYFADSSPSALPSSTKLSATGGVATVGIIGGGFGGLYSALYLAKLSKSSFRPVKIKLIDPSDRFTFSPLLYELAVNDADVDEVCPRYESLVDDDPDYGSVEVVTGEVTAVDFKGRKIIVEKGDAGKEEEQKVSNEFIGS